MIKRFKVSKVSKGDFNRKPTNGNDFSRLATLAGKQIKTPFLKDDCELVIPLNAPDKYRWWAGGQSIFDTLLQLNASDTLIEQHIGPITTPDAWRRWMKIKKDREKYHGRH